LSDRAVFLDPSQKRWSWIKRISAFLGILSVGLVAVFVVSIVTTPLLPKITSDRLSRLRRTIVRSLALAQHQAKMRHYIFAGERKKLLDSIGRDQARARARAAQPPIKSPAVVAAFYAPWQETGIHSLRANASRMTHLLPAWIHLNAEATDIDFRDWDNDLVPLNKQVVEIARTNNLNLLPVLSNAENGDFDARRVHLFLTNPNEQNKVALKIRHWLTANRFQGINIDFENMPAGDYPLLIPFLRRMRAVLQPAGLLVTADFEADKPELDWKAAATLCDFVVVMAYDETSTIDPPGPIASMDWYRKTVLRALRNVPREKLVVGLANYGYDWTEGDPDGATPVTYQEALLTAQDNHPDQKPSELIDFDPKDLNPTYEYSDEEGRKHTVWFLDAVTAANQWLVAQSYGIRGAAVWVLGSNDPSIWKFLDRTRLTLPPNPGLLREVTFPYQVDFVGNGEILRVAHKPVSGSRTLEIEPRTGLLLDEIYDVFPTSSVIQRSGYLPKAIALTIDDGPANPYTAQMLDVLKQYNVKATFFLIGENAERYPALVRRIYREGHDIGNHTYTHPNIGAIPDRTARLEINAMQRALQSIAGHSTLLFRPPYNADAEPSTKEEVTPVMIASDLGYVTVGEFIDSQDWNLVDKLPDGTVVRRGAKEMLDLSLAQLGREEGSCILLHDGGGNRAETVKLLPMLITALRARGYRFVTVSQLMDVSRDAVMPPVGSADTLMLADDRIVFEVIYLGELFLGIAFMSAILLGTLRVIFVTILALLEKRRAARERFDESFTPGVSLLIAAYNEERVIANTILAVLANDYPNLEIIVVDDGSKDDTAGEVRRRFADHPQVRVVVQENAGKAAALNRAIALATNDILIALDADTHFARDTIRKLVRRFADPHVGAVAGNVKVGNRINPLTYWQTIEYITSQNLDRRAYSLINAVTVVPGAVGAWRREAILQAGGYTTDTMAEDMDLTWRIRRIGWEIDTETEAFAYTEAPDSFRALFKQRFRWAFGTLQSLWKHRRAIGRYGWFGRVMLPSLWLFQIIYQALSPLVDLQILYTLGSVGVTWLVRGGLERDWQPLPEAVTSLWLIAFMYAFFFVVELIGSLIAFKLDREDPKMLVWLFWQRFLYRQLMYAVVVKSVKTALSGMRTGWGKLERKGTVELVAE
jgi:poly-beta-1,6 N-acetyl-D-glucosamine synthase